MSTHIKCDVCLDEISEDDNHKLRHVNRYFDLCGPCFKVFEHWISGDVCLENVTVRK